MSWLNIFLRSPKLSEAMQARLEAWKALPEPDLSLGFNQMRFVVMDVETSGFSLRSDRLIAIGACAIEAGKIPLNQSFEVILKQELSSSKENILIHGIGKTAQENGVEPTEALMQFLEYIGKDVLLAFHVGFDQPMLNKALQRFLGINLKNQTWIDVAFIGPMFFKQYARSHKTLDHWCQLFKIKNMSRHNAAADALATAEVMLATMKAAPEELSIKKLKSEEASRQKIHRELHGPI